MGRKELLEQGVKIAPQKQWIKIYIWETKDTKWKDIKPVIEYHDPKIVRKMGQGISEGLDRQIIEGEIWDYKILYQEDYDKDMQLIRDAEKRWGWEQGSLG